MILGVQLYGLMANTGAEVEKILADMKEIGLKRVEPCIDFTIDGNCGNKAFWSPAFYESVKPLLDQYGLEVISCHASTNPENFLEEKTVIYDFIKKHGIKHIILKMPSYEKTAMQELAALYMSFADEIKPLGARILLHNGKPDLETMIEGTTAYEYMADLCCGKVGLQVDTGWALAGGADPIALIERNKERIESLHHKDFNDLNALNKDVSIGDGLVDSAKAKALGIELDLPQFVDQDAYTANYKEEVSRSYAFLNN